MSLKPCVILSVTTLLMLTVQVQGQQVKDGFRGHAWGTPFKEIDTTMVLIHMGMSDGVEFYSTDIDSLAGAAITCALGFYQGQFYEVFIETTDPSGVKPIILALEQVYGEPRMPNRYISKYTYNSDKSWRTFEVDAIDGTGTLIMKSKEINYQKMDDDKKAAEKAKDEF